MQIRAKQAVRLVAAAWAAVTVAGVAAAVATPPSGKISRNELVTGHITDPITIERSEPSDAQIYVVSFEPASDTGWHTHPGPEYVMVKAGEVVLQRAPACEKVTVKAGQGVFIPGGTPHVAHNVGKEPAEVYASLVMPAGTTVTRDDVDEQCLAAQPDPQTDEQPDEQPDEKNGGQPEKNPAPPKDK